MEMTNEAEEDRLEAIKMFVLAHRLEGKIDTDVLVD
jgi:hypothetical protein